MLYCFIFTQQKIYIEFICKLSFYHEGLNLPRWSLDPSTPNLPVRQAISTILVISMCTKRFYGHFVDAARACIGNMIKSWI